MSQPPAARTLSGARSDGTLHPLQCVRLRAQLGMESEVTAANIRRATALLLERIQDYYAVIQYTGPGYIYGRVDSQYPSALRNTARHNYMDDSWSFPEMTPAHPTCTTLCLFNEAGWMCIETACSVATFEMAVEVPEAQEILRQAAYAIDDMLKNREVSAVSWVDCRRRVGTPGVRKILQRLRQNLGVICIGKGPIRPVVLSPGQTGYSKDCKHITDWS